MKFIDMIKKGEGANGEITGDPDKIIEMKLVKVKSKTKSKKWTLQIIKDIGLF